jgi:hypothetical protein
MPECDTSYVNAPRQCGGLQAANRADAVNISANARKLSRKRGLYLRCRTLVLESEHRLRYVVTSATCNLRAVVCTILL